MSFLGQKAVRAPMRVTSSDGGPDDVESLWLATTPETDYDPLDGDRRVDVAVVGGGITGLTAALNLQDAGLEVAVVGADRVAAGTSGNTTAKLTSQHGLKYESLCAKFGTGRAEQYAAANEAAIDEGRPTSTTWVSTPTSSGRPPTSTPSPRTTSTTCGTRRRQPSGSASRRRSPSRRTRPSRWPGRCGSTTRRSSPPEVPPGGRRGRRRRVRPRVRGDAGAGS